MNIITAKTTYATYANAEKKLDKELGEKKEQVRWLIAATPDGRFVPTVVGAEYTMLAHRGIMVVS